MYVFTIIYYDIVSRHHLTIINVYPLCVFVLRGAGDVQFCFIFSYIFHRDV